jgi:hypothetical protein
MQYSTNQFWNTAMQDNSICKTLIIAYALQYIQHQGHGMCRMYFWAQFTNKQAEEWTLVAIGQRICVYNFVVVCSSNCDLW